MAIACAVAALGAVADAIAAVATEHSVAMAGKASAATAGMASVRGMASVLTAVKASPDEGSLQQAQAG